MPLSSEQMTLLTKALKQRQTELNEQVALALPAAAAVTLDQSKVGRLSRMDAMQQQQMADTTLQQTKNQRLLVQKALDKIPSGDYSYCERCDEEIGFERLMVKPEAQLCLRCQSQQEQ